MKKLSVTAFAAAGLMLVSSPVFAATAHKHATHHSKAGKKAAKNNESVSKTDALNAMSLEKARTPVLTPPAVVTVPQKEAKEIQKKTGDAMMPVAPPSAIKAPAAPVAAAPAAPAPAATTPAASVMPAAMPAPAAH